MTSPADLRHASAKRSRALRYLVSFLLTVFFLWFAFRGTDFAKLYESIRTANYGWIAVSFAILMLSHVVRAWRWRYLLEPIKPTISIRNLFSAVMIGYFVNNILPRAGELARPYAIAKRESIPGSAALGTIVVERLIDMVSFLVLVIALPFVYTGPLRESFPWLTEAGVIVAVGTGFVMLVLVVLMVRRDWTDRLLAVTTRVLPPRLGRRIAGFSHSFLDGVEFVKRPDRFLVIGITSVLVWALYVLVTYVAFFAFGLQDRLGLGAAVVLQAISSIGVAIPTPGATGTYHAFAAQTLTRLFSVDGAVALSYATVTHAAGFIGTTIVGMWYAFRDQFSVTAAVGSPEAKNL
jgi:glycosyltransferase 2 family protein